MALNSPDVDGVWLNYARGFCEPDLEFVEHWPIRRLKVLDRKLVDLTPLQRLADTLEDLSVQAAPIAELDLSVFPRLHEIGCEWEFIRETLGSVDDLRGVITWEFGEVDLHAFRDQFALERLTIKHAPNLESLSGIGNLPKLGVLNLVGARRLHDLSDVEGLAASLRRLQFEAAMRSTQSTPWNDWQSFGSWASMTVAASSPSRQWLDWNGLRSSWRGDRRASRTTTSRRYCAFPA